MILDKYCASTKQAHAILPQLKLSLDTREVVELSFSYNNILAPPFLNTLFMELLKAGYDINRLLPVYGNEFRYNMFNKCRKGCIQYYTDPIYANAIDHATTKIIEYFENGE